MIRYIAGRVLLILPVLFGVSIIVFLLIRLIPGNPAIALLGEHATPELIARLQKQLGLNLPLWRQYLIFLGNASHGNFGLSFFYRESVFTLTVERIPVTLMLITYAALIGLADLGPVRDARRGPARDSVDHAIRLVFTGTIGIPSFWLGIVLALLLSVKVRLFPLGGIGTGGLNTVWYLTCPR